MEHLSVFICKTKVGKSVNSGGAPFFTTLIEALKQTTVFQEWFLQKGFFF